MAAEQRIALAGYRLAAIFGMALADDAERQ